MFRRRARRPFCPGVRQRCAILLRSPEPRPPAFPGFRFEAKGTSFDFGRQRWSARGKICFQRFFRYLPRSFMAKSSWVERSERKSATVKKYAALGAELEAK